MKLTICEIFGVDTLVEARDKILELKHDASFGASALEDMVQLWRENHPDDMCACMGASEDCPHPPRCELCSAVAAMERLAKWAIVTSL